MHALTWHFVEAGRSILHPTRKRVFQEVDAAWNVGPMEQAALQRQALIDLLIHAKNTTAFYRDKLPAADDVRRDPYAILRTLPILTKAETMHHAEELRSSAPAGPVFTNHTGGSTGQMLHFKEDEQFKLWCEAIRQKCFGLCGYRPGDRQAFLWGADSDIKVQERIRTRIADVLTNTTWVNTFKLDEQSLVAAVRTLEKWQPRFIWAYASSADLIAACAERVGAVIRPRAVQTTAEVLYPEQRQRIERVFQCRVFDRYGSRESNIIAHETAAHEGLHLIHLAHVIEVLDDHDQPVSPGVPGRIVMTNLRNYAQPFVRYDTADLGVLASEASPGPWQGSVLTRIMGRKVDTIRSASGQYIHGEYFTHLFYNVPEVRQFQIVQTGLQELILRVVPTAPGARPSLDKTVREMSHHGNPPFTIRVEWCEEIPPLPSGKRCFVVSKIK